MEKEKTNLFLTVLKLKSYLASMIDSRAVDCDNFNFTLEYLDRKYPASKSEIIKLLEDNGIYSDRDIAFDDSIILKFREIAHQDKSRINLVDMLSKLSIEARDSVLHDAGRSNYILEREKRLNDLLDIIFQLATNWTVLKELEDNVDDYSILNEEDVIRPEEEANLNALDSTTTKTFNIISDLTKRYIEHLTDYYFTYGGDLSLKEFVEDLEKVKRSVAQKYIELFKRYGLETDWLVKFSK